jgi:3-oxoadipate enol-lactonase
MAIDRSAKELNMPRHALPDLNMFYTVSGDGPPLLFLHGLGSSSRDWENQVDSFARTYQVITLDLRGHGCSEKPPGPYSMRAFAEDTAALIRALGVAPVHIVGISMGAMVAFELVLNCPELIRSLVNVNGAPEMRVETVRERIQVWRRFVFLELLGMRGTGVMLGKHLFPYPEQAELRKIFIQRWAENDKRAYRESLRAIINWDVEARIGEIRCPVLVVASEQDYMPLGEKKRFTEKIPGAKLVVIEDARHAVTVERPKRFNAVVGEFLKEVL